jgi:hypothetical protein
MSVLPSARDSSRLPAMTVSTTAPSATFCTGVSRLARSFALSAMEELLFVAI